MASIRRTVRLSVLLIVIALIAILARVAWLDYGYLAMHSVAAAEPVRWWRCRNSARPMLEDSKNPWEIRYAWTQGYGPGDVFVVIRSDGTATIEAIPHDSPKVSRAIKISLESVSRLAMTVDETGLLCQTPQPRDGYRVHDLGRYSIDVVQGAVTKAVFFDECKQLPDPRAFDAVLDEIMQLKGVIGNEVSWGPEGTASVEGACTWTTG